MVTVHYDEGSSEYERSTYPRCQFYDRETDLCRVYSEKALRHVQRGLLQYGISYFVKQEENELLHLFLHGRKFARCIIRVHEEDLETAIELCDGVEDVELICALPKRDYCPKEVEEKRSMGQDRYHEENYGDISFGKA